MNDAARLPNGFPGLFETDFARLRLRVETACIAEADWPTQVAAGIRAALAFAAAHPEAVRRLANESFEQGSEGVALYERLIAHFSGRLEAGRRQPAENAWLSELTGRSVVGGVAMLIARRLDTGRQDELPALAPEAIQFALAPYLGQEEARRIAAQSCRR